MSRILPALADSTDESYVTLS
ncbi:protein of unknown function [Magnetospirillum sp. XM-1]|nr:protein of unknown function [Magnetospirillum sp. XM-1]